MLSMAGARRPPYVPPDNGNSTPSASNEIVIEIVYEMVMPVISCIGIFGNLAVIWILHQKRRFNGFMYSYMRGLAVTDTLYLIHCLQASILISEHYFLSSQYKPCKRKALCVYVWNVMSPMWNMWAGSSDLIIVFMTIDRFKVTRTIEELQVTLPRPNRCRVFGQVLVAILTSLCFHMPYFFQFKVEPCLLHGEIHCRPETQKFMSTCQGNIQSRCWTQAMTKFALSSSWDIFSIIYGIIMKVIPSTIILVLNLLMLIKLRKVWAHKNKLKASMSCHVHNANATQKKPNSITTISQLLMRAPSLIGYDISFRTGNNNGNKMLPKAKARGGHQKTRNRLLPNKLLGKEMRMTTALVSVVICHVLLTLPGNTTYFLWTVFPSTWDKVPGQLIYDSVSDLLFCINYSMNFYLYCIANQEVREAVSEQMQRIKQTLRLWQDRASHGRSSASASMAMRETTERATHLQ